MSSDAPVSLPKKKTTTTTDSASAPLWSLQAPARREPSPTPSLRTQQLQGLLKDNIPLASKCAARGGTCCRDLKGDDERTLIDPDVVRDIVIGLSDGLTVPFALTAGLSSIGNARLVVLGGLAELIAGSISMGLGGFLASKAELDHYHYLLRQTHARVERSCAGEMEREVHSILGPVGVHENLSRLVAENLRNVEIGDDHDPLSGRGVEGVEQVRAPSAANGVNGGGNGSGSGDVKKQTWWAKVTGRVGKDDSEDGPELKFSQSVGLAAFLLKFGECLEEVPISRLWISAFTIGLSYFLGGLIPLLPYIFVDSAQTGLIISTAVTALILVVFGVFKTHFTGATGGVGGYVWGAFSTMAVGLLAAGAAFAIVKLLEVHE